MFCAAKFFRPATKDQAGSSVPTLGTTDTPVVTALAAATKGVSGTSTHTRVPKGKEKRTIGQQERDPKKARVGGEDALPLAKSRRAGAKDFAPIFKKGDNSIVQDTDKGAFPGVASVLLKGMILPQDMEAAETMVRKDLKEARDVCIYSVNTLSHETLTWFSR